MIKKEILEDIAKECPAKEKWCFLKEYIQTLLDDRGVEQLRLISDYKWFASKEAGYDLGYVGAIKQFVERGYAEKFAGIYQEGMKHDELFYKLFTAEKEEKKE